jgi:hypothetical protein
MSACFEALTANQLFGDKVDQGEIARLAVSGLDPDSLDSLSLTTLAGTYGSTKGKFYVKRLPLREISRQKFSWR